MPEQKIGNPFLETAAKLCFERAGNWKELEQDALSRGQFQLAQKYTDLCKEADDCKEAIRLLKSSYHDEQVLIKDLMMLVEELFDRYKRPEYVSLKNALKRVNDQVNGRIIPR